MGVVLSLQQRGGTGVCAPAIIDFHFAGSFLRDAGL